MNFFKYVGKRLYCEGIPVDRIAQEIGTPCYIYSQATLERHFRAFDEAFSKVPHIIAFAMKANSNLAILRLFARMGGGADIVSGGELFRALKSGVDPRQIVFAGVGKTREEIREALHAKILMINVESSQELLAIDETAKQLGVKAPIALRVNPDINPRTHPYISTGLKKSKFGIQITKAVEQYRLATRLDHVEIVGIHSHIGSQLTQIKPFVDALKRVSQLVQELRGLGIKIRCLDFGGGLGIHYKDETPPHPRDLAKAIVPLLESLGCVLILEPGRVLVGNAGILVTRVLYTKDGESKRFVVVDAGMNDLIRPSLYGAYHKIEPVVKTRRSPRKVDVVGPICESGDFLAQDRLLPPVESGDLLAVSSAGAYGFSMASNYNSRSRPAEVLVQGEKYAIIRERESYDDQIRGERIPAHLG